MSPVTYERAAAIRDWSVDKSEKWKFAGFAFDAIQDSGLNVNTMADSSTRQNQNNHSFSHSALKIVVSGASVINTL